MKVKTEFPKEMLLMMFRRMAMIRRFEDHLYRLFLQGQVPGTLHQCQGQEATAVGVCSCLGADDAVLSTHRPVGHLIAKGASLRTLAAEIWGKATGCAGGKGGQMHLSDMSILVPPSNAIVGGNIPIAVGMALAFKLRESQSVAVSFFGDGASNIGAFHEAVNLAAVKQLPVIFVCENNQYAASTHISLSCRIPKLADRAAAYGIPGLTADGMDVVTVYETAKSAIDRARKGEGPTLLEYNTYRYCGHSRGDPCGYRSKDELQFWRDRDPIDCCRKLLMDKYGERAMELDNIQQQCQQEVEDAVKFAVTSPDPSPNACYQHVYVEKEV